MPSSFACDLLLPNPSLDRALILSGEYFSRFCGDTDVARLNVVARVLMVCVREHAAFRGTVIRYRRRLDLVVDGLPL